MHHESRGVDLLLVYHKVHNEEALEISTPSGSNHGMFHFACDSLKDRQVYASIRRGG